jgi:hypothetical protein
MPSSAVGIEPTALHVRAMFPTYPFSHRLHDEVRLGHHVSPEYMRRCIMVMSASAPKDEVCLGGGRTPLPAVDCVLSLFDGIG